jgi:hypothetical protein
VRHRASLRLAGAAAVRLEYEGHWDAEYVDVITYYDKDGEEIDPNLHRSIQVEDCFRALLKMQYPNWAKDAGAFGECWWDLRQNTLTHEHHRRFVDF